MKKEIWEYSVNRRGFFRDIGFGGVGLGMALLALETGKARAQSGVAATRAAQGVITNPTYGNAAGLQLPFWANGAAWNEAEYFTTIQARRRFQCKTYQNSDIDGDGQDELLGRCAGGILVVRYDPVTGQWLDFPAGPATSDAAGWDQPEYYETVQCADIDGDGIAELLGRGGDGMYAWKYNPATKTWPQFAFLPDVSDAAGWNQQQYYSTLQCADIDGDHQAELLGRGPNGIQVWKNAGAGWNPMSDGPAWSDSAGWNAPPRYATIQCADIDGDGQCELLGRNGQALETWKYDTSTNAWRQLASCPDYADADGWADPTQYGTIQCGTFQGVSFTPFPQLALLGRGGDGIHAYEYAPQVDEWLQLPINGSTWTNANGWNNLEYSGTIQCVDLYGNGQQVVIGRSGTQIEVWTIGIGAWVQLPSGPAWSDAAGWSAVEQYSTIQSARIKGPDGKIQHALLGRAALSVQTYLINPTNDFVNNNWRSSSSAFPEFTGGQVAAYQALATALGSNFPIRQRYDDLSGVLTQWYSQLLAGTIAKPSGIAQADWDAVLSQIETELNWVILVQNRYATLQNTLLTDMYLSKDLSLQTIGDYFNIPDTDPTKLGLAIASTAADSIRAIFSFFPWPISIIGAVAGAASTAITGAQRFMPNGGSAYQVAYAQLAADLANSFGAVITANQNNLALVTGSNGSGTFVPGDFGLLAAHGKQIIDGTWAWPDSTEDVVATSQRGYGTSLWQTLAVAKWAILSEAYPTGYPTQYGYDGGEGQDLTLWIHESDYDTPNYPNAATLGALMDANPGGTAFPLGAPKADIFGGQNGWNISGSVTPSTTSLGSRIQTLGTDIRAVIKSIVRDANTNEIVITVNLHNRGLTAATNIRFDKALIRNRRLPGGTNALAIHYRPHMRIGSGRAREIQFRFPATVPVKDTLLNVTGRYKGGTFGFTLTLQGFS